MELNKMNKSELLAECKNLGITKLSSKNKTELIEIINTSKSNKPTKKKIIIEEDNSPLNEDTAVNVEIPKKGGTKKNCKNNLRRTIRRTKKFR